MSVLQSISATCQPREDVLSGSLSDEACSRAYPNDNGFVRWEVRDLIPSNLYGLQWRSRLESPGENAATRQVGPQYRVGAIVSSSSISGNL
jgi:hypothetical protein